MLKYVNIIIPTNVKSNNIHNSPMNNTKLQFLKAVAEMIKDIHLTEFISEDALHNLKFHIAYGSNPNEHYTIPVFNHVHNEYIDIDKNIAPLIELIWLNDIATSLSCENNVPNNYIWITFETPHDLELFLEIVFKDTDQGNDFYDRGFPGFGKNNGWYYNTVADRKNEAIHDMAVSLSMSVRFPQSDYNTVLNKLQTHFDNKIMTASNYSSSSSSSSSSEYVCNLF